MSACRMGSCCTLIGDEPLGTRVDAGLIEQGPESVAKRVPADAPVKRNHRLEHYLISIVTLSTVAHSHDLVLKLMIDCDGLTSTGD